MNDASDDTADNTAQKIRSSDDRSSGQDTTTQMKSSGRGAVDETPHTDEEQRTRSSVDETPRAKRAADDKVSNSSDDAATQHNGRQLTDESSFTLRSMTLQQR